MTFESQTTDAFLLLSLQDTSVGNAFGHDN